MSEAILISVVIPAYNAERSVGDAISSVFAGNASSVECIVVNDGSSDATAAFAMRAGVGFPANALKVVSQENAGVSAARNRGLALARGQWVAFLDADDVFADGWFEVFSEAVRVNPGVDVIVFNDGCRPGPISASDCLRGCLSAVSRPGNIARSALCCPVAKVYSRIYLRERALVFPSGVKTGEDMLFNAAVYASKATVSAWPESVYIYRKNMSSATNARDSGSLFNELAYHKLLASLLCDTTLIDAEERNLIIMENCLGGLLDVIAKSDKPRNAVKSLMASPRWAAYRSSLDSFELLMNRFSLYQRLALSLIKDDHIRAAAFLLKAVRCAKRFRYVIGGGVVSERI